jgi:hypothetical protein
VIVDGLGCPAERKGTAAQDRSVQRIAPSYHATIRARSSGEMEVILPGGMAWLRPAWR